MRVLELSDLPVGDRHSRVADLAAFLERLPPGADLVLNGDVVDHRHARLGPTHRRVLDLLREQSTQRRVTWVRGNHDATFVLPDPRGIVFCADHAVEKRLYVAHGQRFDRVMVRHRPLFQVLRLLHLAAIRCGADAIHTAQLAKRFPILFRLLCRQVRNQAVAYARQQGYAAVTCGHTHGAEDSVHDGVRYLNTGAWTDPDPHVVDVTDDALRLVPAGDL